MLDKKPARSEREETTAHDRSSTRMPRIIAPNCTKIESGAELVTFTVANARPVDSKSLFALVDVEMQITGVTFEIRGVQARRIANGGTSVELPTF
jgi:hypothetical protein